MNRGDPRIFRGIRVQNRPGFILTSVIHKNQLEILEILPQNTVYTSMQNCPWLSVRSCYLHFHVRVVGRRPQPRLCGVITGYDNTHFRDMAFRGAIAPRNNIVLRCGSSGVIVDENHPQSQ